MSSFKIYLTAVFMLLVPQVSFAGEDYLIKINLLTREILLISEDKELLRFPVAVPKVIPKNLPIKGEIKEIKKDPHWYPTEKTRQDRLKKGIHLPAIVKPGDPQNAMGVVKMIVKFKTPGTDPSIRIHGTNDESSIGKKITRGCIRLHNNDITKLAEIIKGKSTSIIIE